MLETIDAVEYAELMAVLAVEPIPDVRADLRSARQTWSVFQSQSRKRLRESDFVLSFRERAAINPAVYKQLAAARYARHNAAFAARKR